ncbi:MAG: hypothetical protein FJZ63_02685 [Chlamydiae bacterium]|nr:hypothetical protein [Chlamydiota bacterium]
MLELNPFRKNKVNLQDYDYQKDIQNRLLMARLDAQDLIILEELLYGHAKLCASQLAQDLLLDEAQVTQTLNKLADSGLFQIKEHAIFVNKEVRKYFEAQLQKFEDNFVPGMEYLQTLLRKVPFHILLTWYPIPRTSNNIFDSLVEKYLLTPQTFQRYLLELNFGNETIASIVDDIYHAPNFSLPAEALKKKYNLSDEEFEEIALHLEFNFVGCLTYEQVGDRRLQVLSPFHEWKEYLCFLRDSKPQPLTTPKQMTRYRKQDFAFIEDMTLLLSLLKTTPLALTLNTQEEWIPDKTSLKKLSQLIVGFEDTGTAFLDYLKHLIKKLVFLKLCKIDASLLKLHEDSREWLSFSLENRALSMYKHTLLRLEQDHLLGEIGTERNVREIEKNLHQVLHLGWVCFEDFLKGLSASLNKESKVTLKKQGKHWKYTLPSYTDEECSFIRRVIFEWLFEAGLVSIGHYKDKEYFCITPFGQSIFS